MRSVDNSGELRERQGQHMPAKFIWPRKRMNVTLMKGNPVLLVHGHNSHVRNLGVTFQTGKHFISSLLATALHSPYAAIE